MRNDKTNYWSTRTSKFKSRFALLSVWAMSFSLVIHFNDMTDFMLPLVVAVLFLPTLLSYTPLLETLFKNTGDKMLAVTICTISGLAALWFWQFDDFTFDRTVIAIIPIYQIGMYLILFDLFVRSIGRPPTLVVLDLGNQNGRGMDQLFFFGTCMAIGIIPLLAIRWSQA